MFLCVTELAKYVQEFHFVLLFIARGWIIWREEYHILFPLTRLLCTRAVLHKLPVQGYCCIEGTKISGLDEPLFFKDVTHAHG